MCYGAVIHDGHASGCDLLTDCVTEGGTAFPVEVTFQAMADSLVQQDAWPAGP